jgi:hypothetical protein
MVWLPQSPDLNPIEAYPNITKSDVGEGSRGLECHSQKSSAKVYFFYEEKMPGCYCREGRPYPLLTSINKMFLH